MYTHFFKRLTVADCILIIVVAVLQLLSANAARLYKLLMVLFSVFNGGQHHQFCTHIPLGFAQQHAAVFNVHHAVVYCKVCSVHYSHCGVCINC